MKVSEVRRSRLRWIVPSVFVATAATCLPIGSVLHIGWLQAIGVLAAVYGGALTFDALGWVKDGLLAPRDPAEQRVKRLTEALSESTKVIAEIEREVKARSELADRLQEDVERHQELLELSRAEVEAVAQTLTVEVRREGRRGFWTQIAVGSFFFGIGVIVTLLLT